MTGSRVWFITGCSSGFGKLISREALRRGDKVIATARNATKLEDLKDEGAAILEVDITCESSVMREKAKEAEAIYGQVDVVVNNAGFGGLGTLEELGPEGLLIQYQVNVFGLANVTSAFLPYMRKRRAGTIVIHGSRSGWRVTPAAGAYASSKAAANMYAETLAKEVAPFNVKVLPVIPGGFFTEGTTGAPDPHIRNPATSYEGYREIEDYAPLRGQMSKYLVDLPGSQVGDPKKYVKLLVDLVRDEGATQGRKWPERLIAGSDAIEDIKITTGSIIKTINEWEDIIKSTDR